MFSTINKLTLHDHRRNSTVYKYWHFVQPGFFWNSAGQQRAYCQLTVQKGKATKCSHWNINFASRILWRLPDAVQQSFLEASADGCWRGWKWTEMGMLSMVLGSKGEQLGCHLAMQRMYEKCCWNWIKALTYAELFESSEFLQLITQET